MSMKFYVKSRRLAEKENQLRSPHVIISIYTPGDRPANLAVNEYTQDIHRLCISDLDREPGEAYTHVYGEAKLFNEQDAKDIADFMKKNILRAGKVIVHCDMGVSRSAAVAAALSLFYNGDDSEFFSPQGFYINPHKMIPNMLVYRTLTNYLMEHKDEYPRPAEVQEASDK